MLKGKYVALRSIEEEDLHDLMTWRNNPDLRKYFRETFEINSLKQKLWYKSINDPKSNQIMFSIVNSNTDELLGACGLCYIDWVNRSADFSIYIGYNNIYIDDKYAKDAGDLMIVYGFNILNLHRLWAEIYSIDTQKQVYFKSMNFKKDAIMRETYWYQGNWHDSIFYSKLSTD
jgi:RimJ/RimL family protein N-acetyltransferase